MGRNERDKIASEILRAHDLKQMQIDEEAARTLKASQAQEEEVRSALWRAFELATLKALERLRSNDWPNPTILHSTERTAFTAFTGRKLKKRSPGWLVESVVYETYAYGMTHQSYRSYYLLSSGDFDVDTNHSAYSPLAIFSRLELFEVEIYRADVPKLIPKLNRLATLE